MKTTNESTTGTCVTCNKAVRLDAAHTTKDGRVHHAQCPPPAEAKSTKAAKPTTKPAPKADKPAPKPTTKPAPKSAPKSDKPSTPQFKATDDRNPYAAGVIAQSWEACLKGTTVKSIEAACEKAGIGAGRVLRHMKGGEWKGVKWSVAFDKAKGTIKIVVKAKATKAA